LAVAQRLGATMESLNDLVLTGLVQLFKTPGLALILSLAIVSACCLIVFLIYQRRYRPVYTAVRDRLFVLQSIIPDSLSAHDAQEAFAADFDGNIDLEMSKGGLAGAASLQRAWAEYKETLVDRAERPLRNTVRPEAFFAHTGDDLRLLGWWANIFVAIGLVLTFLGLIAALAKATQGMADPQSAIPDLLKIAAAKFFTSVAGVLSSIICRVAERRMRVKLRSKVAQICELLERGLVYAPPQALAAEQLVQLREQTAALKIFKTELAASIGEQFERQNQPVISVLGDISATLNAVKEGGFAEISRGMDAALSKSTGREMTALSEALTKMTNQFGSVNERIQAGGDFAGQRIREAADQFATAAAGISTAFADMNGRIDDMASRMTEQGSAASNAAADRFEELLGRFNGVAEGNAAVFEHSAGVLREAAGSAGAAISVQVGRELEEATSRFASTAASMDDAFSKLASRLEVQASRSEAQGEETSARSAERFERVLNSLEAVGERNASAFDQAAGTLNRAAVDAAAAARRAVDESMSTATALSSDVLRTTLAEFRDTFARETRSLSSAVSDTAVNMGRLSKMFDEAVKAAGLQTQRMAETAAKAAGDFDRAAAPVRDSTKAVAEAMGQMRGILEASAEASRAAAGESLALAEQMRATANDANRAWQEYSARFAGVDKELGDTLRQIIDAAKGNADHLTDHVNKIDKGLAEAITKLARHLEPISDLAEKQDEIIDELMRARDAFRTPAAA
jgi:hypothetical protein